jgi:hypothetical protein
VSERQIDGQAKTVRQLLSGAKYAIDYYQREYKWETKQVAELITDLTNEFLDSYEDGQERSAVENYGHYFLGSINHQQPERPAFHNRWSTTADDAHSTAHLSSSASRRRRRPGASRRPDLFGNMANAPSTWTSKSGRHVWKPFTTARRLTEPAGPKACATSFAAMPTSRARFPKRQRVQPCRISRIG